MTKNCLVLFTKQFPFGRGETFIEPEYLEMSRHFTEIHIIATKGHSYSEKTRKTIGNTHAVMFTKEETAEYIQKHLEAIGSQESLDSIISENVKFKLTSEFVYEKSVEYLKNFQIEKFNRVIFYSFWCDETAYVATRLKKKYKNARAVSRAHFDDLYVHVSKRNYLPYRDEIYSNLDCICPSSKDGEKYLLDNYPVYAKKIYCSYLGCIDYGINPRRNISDDFHILSCSRLIPHKRVHLIPEALSIVNKKYRLQWTVVGDGIERIKIEQLAKKWLPSTSVNFLGSLSHDELILLYKKTHFDLQINVSDKDGMPVTLMESLSFGVPIIATDVGANRELVNMQTGTLLPVDFTASDLASQIISIIELDEDAINNLRAQCRQFWQINFMSKPIYSKFYNDIFRLFYNVKE